MLQIEFACWAGSHWECVCCAKQARVRLTQPPPCWPLPIIWLQHTLSLLVTDNFMSGTARRAVCSQSELSCWHLCGERKSPLCRGHHASTIRWRFDYLCCFRFKIFNVNHGTTHACLFFSVLCSDENVPVRGRIECCYQAEGNYVGFLCDRLE